ncbi:hypothetical protein CRENBAI_013830 [Crenichthys baileyi]|uniref:Uncharacterized protein n=1 Tax=Crenichthys baileyi TaxID=28760 RepID=A0AAV9SDP7_9TELE
MEANEDVEAAYMEEFKAATSEELNDLQRADIEKTEKESKKKNQNWKSWATPAKREEFDCRLRELEVFFPKLVMRKAVIIKVASMKEDSERQLISVPSSASVAAIKLKAQLYQD